LSGPWHSHTSSLNSDLTIQKRSTLIRPPSVNRQKGARTILTRFLLESLQQFPGSDSYFSQPASGPQEGPAPNTYRGSHRCLCFLCSGCADIIRATWKLYRTLMPSHSRSRARVFTHGAVGTGLGEGQNTTETEAIVSSMYGAGRGSNPGI
jgi:hypothetical protein